MPSRDSAIGAPTTRMRFPGASNRPAASTMRRQRATRSAAAALTPPGAPDGRGRWARPPGWRPRCGPSTPGVPCRMPIASRSPRKISISSGVSGTTSRKRAEVERAGIDAVALLRRQAGDAAGGDPVELLQRGRQIAHAPQGVGIEDAVRPRRLEHHHDRVAQPEVLAHLGVEAHRRIAGRHQRVAVGAELEPQEPRRGEQHQDGEGEDRPPRMVDREIRQPVEAEGGAAQLGDPVEKEGGSIAERSSHN